MINFNRQLVVVGVVGILALLSACGTLVEPEVAHKADVPDRIRDMCLPLTIPALQQWTCKNGQFTLTSGDHLLLVSADATDALMPIATMFARELKLLTNIHFTVESDLALQPQSGDIRLALAQGDCQLTQEGYQDCYKMVIGNTIEITAPTEAGVFYGTRTLLQLFHQSSRIHAGVVNDWPRYRERGLLVDIGRKYFSETWLEQRVQELAYLKMNYLHLHISDDLGFGIESKQYPIASPTHLSQCEVKALLAVAHKYHVTVVPEIDMPGHMCAALAPYPEFQLTKSVLDITNQGALTFAHSLINEFMDLFDGPYWHDGADEVLVTPFWLDPGKDALHEFLNVNDGIVRSHGKKMRIWNDEYKGGNVMLNSDIIVEWWTDFSFFSDWSAVSPQALLDAGHKIMNSGAWPTYYLPGGPSPCVPTPTPTNPCACTNVPSLQQNPDMSKAYESWAVDEFLGDAYFGSINEMPPIKIDASEKRNRGSKLSVWNDNLSADQSEAKIAEDIFPPLRVVAQKTWESKLLTRDYNKFLEIMYAIGGAPH